MVSSRRPASAVNLLERLVEVPAGDTVRFVPIPAPPPPVPLAPPPEAGPALADPAGVAWREAQPVASGPSGRRRQRPERPDREPRHRAASQRVRGPRRLWRVRGVLFWFVRGVLMAIAGAIAVPGMLGYHALTVLSGSMEPAIHTGDVVVERAISPLEARVGDIVIFRDPGDQNIMITHRARAIRVADGIVHFTTKGDANNTVERWTVPVDGSVGLVRFRVKRLGFALVWGSSRSGRLALVVLPALFLGGYELLKIWRPNRKPPGASAT